MKSNKTARSYEQVEVTFRFVGDSVNPKVITSKIGIQPSKTRVKGDVVEKHPDRTHPTGFWGLDSSISPNCPLEEHLRHLLDILDPQASAIKEFSKVGLCPSFFCGFFTAKAEFGTLVKLEADTLKRVADIGAALELHIYCCGEEN